MANRANAQKSTGPKSEEGKECSRANALKHGLAGAGVVWDREDDVLYKERLEEYQKRLDPIDVLEHDLVGQMAAASVQMERARDKGRTRQAARRKRAEGRWRERQLVEIEPHLAILQSQPAIAVHELEKRVCGCQWLVDQWVLLRHALQERGEWGREELDTALCLLGRLPRAFHEGDEVVSQLRKDVLGSREKLDPDEADALLRTSTAHLEPKKRMEVLLSKIPDQAEARASLLRLIEREVARLVALQDERLRGLDGLSLKESLDCALVDTSPAGERLERYRRSAELSLHRNVKLLVRLRWLEPPHATRDRWAKMGEDKDRFWNGTNYEPRTEDDGHRERPQPTTTILTDPDAPDGGAVAAEGELRNEPNSSPQTPGETGAYASTSERTQATGTPSEAPEWSIAGSVPSAAGTTEQASGPPSPAG